MNAETTCYLCKKSTGVVITDSSDNPLHKLVRCERCGKYLATTEVALDAAKVTHPSLSGYCREVQELYSTSIPTVISEHGTKPKIQAPIFTIPDQDDIDAKSIKLLSALRRKSHNFGDIVRLDYSNDYPLAYAANEYEIQALVEYLQNLDLITGSSDDSQGTHTKLSARGWQRLNSTDPGHGKQAFIASWFHTSTEESIQAISEAVKDCNFTAMCIKTEFFSEMIIDKALGELRNSRFVIVDLTNARPSVLFEAGFAVGLGLEVIYVYKKTDEAVKTELEFYVKHYQCKPYANVNELKQYLVDAIRARIR